MSDKPIEANGDLLGEDYNRQLLSPVIPQGVDRRNFLMRSAVGGAAAVMTGCATTPEEKAAKAVETLPPSAAAATVPLAQDLYVVMKSKGPVMTVSDEFYKVRPGPTSSNTVLLFCNQPKLRSK